MKKLTAEQLLAVVNLSQNPLIDFTTISTHKGGHTMITVISELDAQQNEINGLLAGIFPSMKYEGTPFQPQSKRSVSSTLYDIAVREDGVRISLHMNRDLTIEKLPAPTESIEEIIHPDCIIDLSRVEPLVDQVMAEEVLSEGVTRNA